MKVPIRSFATRLDIIGRPDAELLSVYREHGVVPKSSRDDNFNKPSEDLSTYRYVRPGNLVLNKMKTWQGSLAVSEFEGIVSPAYFVCELSDSVHPRFIHHLLRSDALIGEYGARSKGIRPNQWDLPYDEFKSIEVDLPSIEEQRRIADFLDDQVGRIDQAIELGKSQMSCVIEVRDETIAAALIGSRATRLGRPPWFTDIPTSWVLTPLRARWQVIDCKHRTPNYVDEGIPVISPGDISPGPLNLASAGRFVNAEDYADLADDLRRCRVGDLVYSRNASAGIAAMVTADSPFTMGQDVCRITSLNEDQRYLMYWLNTLSAPQLDSVRVGSTFTRINVDQIKAFKVPAPSVAEQRTIALECDRVWNSARSQSDAYERQGTLFEERKRSLISAAVTGQLDVTSARPLTGPWIHAAPSTNFETMPKPVGMSL